MEKSSGSLPHHPEKNVHTVTPDPVDGKGAWQQGIGKLERSDHEKLAGIGLGGYGGRRNG